MRCFHGRDGELFAVSLPYQFHSVPMEDCGGGFDWRVSDRSLSYWLPGVQARIELHSNGVREQIFPVEVHNQMGRVGFGRCLEGKLVRASGVCLPLTLLAKINSWEVYIETVINQAPVLHSENLLASTKVRETTAILRDVPTTISGRQVVARLWPTPKGALVGRGNLKKLANKTVLTYDDEGVRYESY